MSIYFTIYLSMKCILIVPYHRFVSSLFINVFMYLGDVYLKYSVGHFMFYAYTSYQRQEEETRGFTEGDMTAMRSKV